MDIIDLIRAARAPLGRLQPDLRRIPHFKPAKNDTIVTHKQFHSTTFGRYRIMLINPKLSKANEII